MRLTLIMQCSIIKVLRWSETVFLFWFFRYIPLRKCRYTAQDHVRRIIRDNEFLPDLYELEDENGNKQTFELLDAMEYGDEKYYALTPYYENGDEALEDSGDVVILKAEYDENNDEILASIEDDDEYEKIGQMFMERIDEMFEFDDEDEDDDCGCGCGCHDHDHLS